MKFWFFGVLLFVTRVFAAPPPDYEYLPYLDQNIKVGLGMSYSKLESNSDVGNYYLLSAANVKFEASYSSPIINNYRHKFFFGLLQEMFRPENDSFSIKTKDARYSAMLGWQPMWLNEDKTFIKHFTFLLKNQTVITEIPNTFTTVGDIGDRYAIDAGVGFSWYGLTVSKFPIGFDAEVLYTQTLLDHSATTVYNGLSYRMSIDFEFKKRSLFSGWGMKGYYQYDDLKNSYTHTIDKELGIIFSKATVF